MIVHRVALHKYTRKKVGKRYEDEHHLDEIASVTSIVPASLKKKWTKFATEALKKEDKFVSEVSASLKKNENL